MFSAKAIALNARSKAFASKAVSKSEKVIAGEKQFGASNYAPLPVVFSKAQGCTVTNPEGRQYIDFLSGYGAVSQGHVHPKVIAAAKKQLDRCTLSSRAFYNDQLASYAEYVTKMFKYEKMLPMNTGAEGVETALKLARRWGYEKKRIPANKAIIVCASGNFHGRTFGAITLSDDPSSYKGYGPLLPGIKHVKYGDTKALSQMFIAHGKNICGFICEPIQGEAGVIIPPHGYLQEVRRLCTKHNILYIDDEVQAGLGRSGKMLAVEHEKVRPDIVVLAKALGAGVLPVACVLADAKHMNVFTPGTHGSTFGGSPLGAAVAVAALKALKEENMVENSARQGALLGDKLKAMKQRYPFIYAVRCRGLFAAIEMKKNFMGGQSAVRLMTVLKNNGLLAKVTHGYTLRLSPPLVMTKAQIFESCRIMDKSLAQLATEDATRSAKKAMFAPKKTVKIAKKQTVKSASATPTKKQAAKPVKAASHQKQAAKPVNTASHQKQAAKPVKAASHQKQAAKPVKAASHQKQAAKPVKAASHQKQAAKPVKAASHQKQAAKPVKAASHQKQAAKPVEVASRQKHAAKPAASKKNAIKKFKKFHFTRF